MPGRRVPLQQLLQLLRDISRAARVNLRRGAQNQFALLSR